MNSNTIKILHLSDFHFENKNENQDKIFNSLVSTIEKEHNNKPFDYIFITGDVINRGQPEIYETAQNYINSFITKLNFDKNDIFIVPGNHDNNFNLEFSKNIEEEEETLRNSLQSEHFDKVQQIECQNEKFLTTTKQRQKSFFNFIKQLGINTTIPNCSCRDNDIYIISLNSSIFSSKNDHRNQIYFIDTQFEKSIHGVDFTNKKVFILSHHPIDYLEENIKDKILDFARKHNAFIFSGHSHIQAYEKQFRNNKTAHQFWCGNFQENNASFNIVELDYELKAFRLSIGEKAKDKWNIKSYIADKIENNQSDILSFLMDVKKEQNKLQQFKMLWNKLFNSPVLAFEDFWEDSSLLITKDSDIKLRKKLKRGYSDSERSLLYLLFQNLDHFKAVKLFRDIPINLDKLNWYPENIYKRDLLNTAASIYPELFKYP